jgi:hypothetical protein
LVYLRYYYAIPRIYISLDNIPKPPSHEQLVPIHIFRQPHPRQQIIAGLQWKAFEREKDERVLAEKVSVIGR